MKIVRKITLPPEDSFLSICGPYDQYLKMVRDEFGVKLGLKENVIKLSGAKTRVEQARQVLSQLVALAQTSPQGIESAEVINLIKAVRTGPVRSKSPELSSRCPSRRTSNGASSLGREISSSESGASVQPRTSGQARYLETMERNDIVFSIGPAGTGKTYLAVARALTALRKGVVKKIVLARPAVEAGERLGFLPGSYQAKVNPYLRPLYDALSSFLAYEQLRRLMESEIIEVIPLAYMRGRNLDDAFIILDEAQNTTSDQMKMFLTRMGNRSKIVVTGDITQIDLPENKISGLVEVQTLLDNIPGIAFAYLTRGDIVRHPLVQSIVDCYAAKTSHPLPRKKRNR